MEIGNDLKHFKFDDDHPDVEHDIIQMDDDFFLLAWSIQGL